MIGRNILIQDDRPCYYIYRQRMGNHEQYGIVAGFSVEEYEKGLIKKHELTRTDKEMDRTRHIDIVGAHTGPVFLTFKARKSLDRIVASIVAETPEYDFTADDGIGHTAWVVRDGSLIDAIRNEFARIDALYIADGHHRRRARPRQTAAGKQPRPTGATRNRTSSAVAFPTTSSIGIQPGRQDLNGLDEAAQSGSENFSSPRISRRRARGPP